MSKSSVLEALLMDRVRAGDSAAAEKLLSQKRSTMFSIALKLSKNWDDAEEVTQRAMIKASQFLASFRGESALSTWLYSIVLCSYRDLLRSRKVEHSCLKQAVDSHPEILPKIIDYSGEEATQNRLEQFRADSQERFYSQLSSEFLFEHFQPDCLTPAETRSLVLRFQEDKILREVGEELGVYKSGALRIINRALEKLRQNLPPTLEEESCPNN